jgi:hypothetical protein
MIHPPQTKQKAARIRTKILHQSGVSAAFFESASLLPAAWNLTAPGHNLLLHQDYLLALEQNPPKGMRFGYLMFFRQGQPIGVAALQVLHFKADQSLSQDEDVRDGRDTCFFRAFGKYLRSLVASQVEFTTIVCGSLLVTGEHGFYFKPGAISDSDLPSVVEKGVLYAQEEFAKRGMKPEVTFVKDFFENKSDKINGLRRMGYNEFCVQPNMILDIPPHWHTFDDYLHDLSSKYRVRARRAFKKMEGVERCDLSEKQIWAYNDRIFELYQHVADNADFNVIQLHPDYLLGLKQHLGDRFRMTGYFLDKQLIGFCTTIHNPIELEAHFLGYDPGENTHRQLYLNMLYDIIREGIEAGCQRINFARTALEIKSSVGAVPHQMYCYIRHRNSFANRFLKPLLDYLAPDNDWEPRHPFRKHDAHEEDA